MEVLGVSRSSVFSPHSEERDSASFSMVTDGLQKAGHVVHEISENDLFEVHEDVDCVFTMARSTRALKILQEMEERHIPVFNSAKALLENTRTMISQLFVSHGVPAPNYQRLILGQQPTLSLPFWLKRGDACAQSSTDVRFISSKSECEAALYDFNRRHVRDVLAVEHLQGDLVKFYGVEGTDFFYFYYSNAAKGFSKFGLEKINGAPHFFSFSSATLKHEADKAARLTGFIIYGGDCIVGSDGVLKIIDFNDWPSFSSCREEASRAIVARIIDSYGK